MKLLVLLVALATLFSVDALKCQQCTYMEGTSDNEVMTMMLDAMTAASDQDCKDDAGNVATQECSGHSPPSGHIWKCGKADLRTTLSQSTQGQTISANMRVINRACVPAAVAQEKYNDGCHPASDFKEELSAALPQGGETSLGDLKGEFCVCTEDECNSATSHSAVMFLVVVMTAFVFFIKQ